MQDERLLTTHRVTVQLSKFTGQGAWISVVLRNGDVVRTQALVTNRPNGPWARDVRNALEAAGPR